ncbi:MAG: flagellar biosynthetic protein FliQ [Kiritimatiellia bacterium]|jgi:flagellar biosynthetic protein FliQ
MDTMTAVFLGQQALITSLMIGGPLLLTALVVGTAISVLQTVTQVQEMTLVFVPKIIAVFLVLALSGAWMLQVSVTYATDVWSTIGETR